MYIPKSLRTFCAVILVLLLSNIPHVVFAETARNSLGLMIPTSEVVNEMASVESFLKLEEVQKQLQARGISAEEAKHRIASLSETELRQLSKQIDEARAGGDILVAILIVVLIIFLIKRI